MYIILKFQFQTVYMRIHLNPVLLGKILCVHIVKSPDISKLVRMVHNNSSLVHILHRNCYTHNNIASVLMLGWCHLRLLDV